MAANKSLTEERDDYKKGYSPSSTTGSDAPRDHNLDEEKYGNADAGEPRGFDGLANISEGQGEVFGDETDKQVKYRTMEWWHAALVMIAETISLGILSLPSSMAGLGLVPGVILIIGLGAVSTYTGYVFWQFKMRYPHVHNIADVGEIFLGPIGRELGGFLQTTYLIFIMGSHLLTWTIAMNTITNHATCTIVWSVIGLVLHAVLTFPRTLKNVSYLSIFAFISIFAAVMITMVSVGVTRPDPTVYATVTTSFASAFSSVMNIIFAFGGHVAFFSFISELKDPRDFPKALYTLQIVNTSLYVIAAVVIYRFAGPGVASPARARTSSARSPTASRSRPSSSPASSTATSRASTSTCASSAARATCTSARCSPTAPGSGSCSRSGSWPGSSPRACRSSTTSSG
jgi:hypothetical protein